MENTEKINNLIYYYKTKMNKYEDVISRSKMLDIQQDNKVIEAKIELIKEFLTKLELIMKED